MKRLVFAPLIAVVAMGCDSASAPDGAQFSFVAQRVDTFVDTPEIVLSTSSSGGVQVLGGLWVGCGGAELSGHATTNGVITIDVIADVGSPGKACYAMVESFTYTASVSGLPSGTYSIQVRHTQRWWEADPAPRITRTEHFVARVR